MDDRNRMRKSLLLVVPDSELKVAGHNTLLLVVASSVAGELEDLGSKVFQDSCEVHCFTFRSVVKSR